MNHDTRYKDNKILTSMRVTLANRKRLARIAEYENTNRTAVVERFIEQRYTEIKNDLEKL